MSRPLRPIALALAATTLCLAGCKTSTPYAAVYSPRRNYFVPPPVKVDKAAEDLLTATDAPRPTGLPGGLPADGVGLPPGLPPAGLPPPAPPAADPLAPPTAL
jgi:hypothetical protein